MVAYIMRSNIQDEEEENDRWVVIDDDMPPLEEYEEVEDRRVMVINPAAEEEDEEDEEVPAFALPEFFIEGEREEHLLIEDLQDVFRRILSGYSILTS